MFLSKILNILPILATHSDLIKSLTGKDDVDFPDINEDILKLFELYFNNIFTDVMWSNIEHFRFFKISMENFINEYIKTGLHKDLLTDDELATVNFTLFDKSYYVYAELSAKHGNLKL